jgi:hypothetical protein
MRRLSSALLCVVMAGAACVIVQGSPHYEIVSDQVASSIHGGLVCYTMGYGAVCGNVYTPPPTGGTLCPTDPAPNPAPGPNCITQNGTNTDRYTGTDRIYCLNAQNQCDVNLQQYRTAGLNCGTGN